MKNTALVLVLLTILLCTTAGAADCSVTSTGNTPLYPSMFVPRTAAEESAGLAAVNSITPGPTVILSIGMSNAKGLWAWFIRDSNDDSLRNPDVTLVNGAIGGGATSTWAVAGDPKTWGKLDGTLADAGATRSDVSVIWFVTHNHVGSQTVEQYATALESDARDVLDLFAIEFPNLKVVWFEPMIYGGYSTASGTQEPHTYESGVVVQRLLVDPNWPFFVGYGPYMWADGMVPRADGLTWLCSDFDDDGNHPGRDAKIKHSAYLLQFFQEDSIASIGYLDTGSLFTVPDVVGLDQASAEAAILSENLTVGAVSTANSDSVPAGDVITQDPAGGSSVAEGTAVDLVVSLGPVPLVVVPDVVGLDQASAEAAILSANLAVGIVSTANSDTVPAGNVISQDPTGGTSVVEGTAVGLVVSLGPLQMTVVPDVVGLDQANAEAAILSENLAVGIVSTANSDTVPAGDVISQDPAGGSSVPEGTAVDLVVSLGPVQLTVPDVVGLEQASAEAAIVSAGLLVGTVSTANSVTVPAGDVISQDPTGGSVVAEGTAVDLVVSLGPVLVIVPDVVGLDQASAEAAILSANLAVGAVTTANSDTVPVGDVISQDPAGGASVAEGAAVDLVVSLGPEPLTTVPDVVGLDQASAEASIVSALLVVGTVTTTNSDTVAAGDVISQDPTGGSSVAEGTAVDLVVSLGPVTGVPMMISPVDGSVLPGSSETFTWSAEGAVVTNWRLEIGTTPGGSDILRKNFASGETSELVTGLPTDGSLVYVTLNWRIDGVSSEADYVYTASGDGPPPVGTPAIISPVPETVLSGASETFVWSAESAAVTRWRLEVGTTPDGTDLFVQSLGAEVTSTVISGLPTDGSLVYVNLKWRIGGVTSVASYVYTASGGSP